MKKLYGWIVGLVLFCFICTGLFFALAPELIPVHYNLHGEVDRWGSKYEFLVFPVLDLIAGGLMLLVSRYEGRKGRGENEKIVAGLTVWMLVVFNVLWIFFMAKAFDPAAAVTGLGDFSAKGLVILMLVLFVAMGNYMPKVRRNSMLGLRTKWSMASDACWQRSQRLGGYTLVLCGAAGIIPVALLPASWSVWLLLGIVGVLLVVSIVGSWRIYKEEIT